MADGSGIGSALKEILYENLLGCQSSDSSIRSSAETQLKLLETNDEFGLHLVDIALNESIPISIRKLSAVLLKQYIENHWTAANDKHIPPEVLPHVKSIIRDVLLKTLNSNLGLTADDSGKNLRSLFAYAVSCIAHYDWPEEWPLLGQTLINYLSSNNRQTLYSAMKVFVELSHEVTDSQMPSIAPLLLPKMLEIFVSPQEFSLRTRGRAVQIFTTLAETIAQMGEYDKKAVDLYLEPILSQFTEALVKVLYQPDAAIDVDIGLKKDVINCLTILLRNFRSKMKKWMPQILEPVWYCLTSSAGIYVKTFVNVKSCDYDNDHELYAEVIDSDGEVLGFESLIFAIFDFISVVIETPKFRKLVKPVISELVYYIIIYMQITDEQTQTWIENPEQFVEDEDDDSYSYSIRISALDLVLAITKEFDFNESAKKLEEFKAALIAAVNKHLVESRSEMPKMHNAWKIQEACLLAIGSVSATLIETIKSNSPLTDTLKAILDSIFSNTTELSPFLSGRSLWTASRYAEIMNPESVNRFLQSTTSGLMAVSPVLRIAAARAVWGFSDYIKTQKQTHLIKPYLQPMLDGLVSIGTQYSTEVLSLVLEAISVLISIDKLFTASVELKVSTLTIAAFLKYTSDPVLISITQDVFAELSKNEHCIIPLQQRLIPTLVSILQPSQPNPSVTSLQPTALETLTTIVKHSPLPLSDTLIGRGFAASVGAVLSTSDDTATLQNGGECVRMFVTKSMEQIANFHHVPSNQNGVALLLQVCHHLLDPRINESCSSFVGRLTTSIIINGGQFIGNDNIQLLLRAVLVKLQSSETLSVIQSLVLVFAHLINYDLPTILDFLSSLPAPTGVQSALEFVLCNWLNRQHLFFGAYENKVSILALCKLLEHSIVNSADDSKLNLNRITVHGDPIVSDYVGIKTRSKSAANPVQWTRVPCSVKILKLLLSELKSFEDECETQSENTDDDEDEECDSREGGDGIASSKIDPSMTGVIDEEWADGGTDLDEDDVLNHEIGKVNLENHLSNILREFKKTPFLNDFLSHLTDSEKIILNKIN